VSSDKPNSGQKPQHKKTLATLSPDARREIAWTWCLVGFRLSGDRFNGETHDPAEGSATESLLRSEFERVYGS
jgi:hypothetical protein